MLSARPIRLEHGPGDQDGFVAKLNTNASGAASLVYSTFCDVHAPYSNSIDIDAAGNAYVTGRARRTETQCGWLRTSLLIHHSGHGGGQQRRTPHYRHSR